MEAATMPYRLATLLCPQIWGGGVFWRSEAEFLDVIGKKVLKVFFLAIHSHLY
jgi:hypothetical protein